jgi:hypothetical protein
LVLDDVVFEGFEACHVVLGCVIVVESVDEVEGVNGWVVELCLREVVVCAWYGWAFICAASFCLGCWLWWVACRCCRGWWGLWSDEVGWEAVGFCAGACVCLGCCGACRGFEEPFWNEGSEGLVVHVQGGAVFVEGECVRLWVGVVLVWEAVDNDGQPFARVEEVIFVFLLPCVAWCEGGGLVMGEVFVVSEEAVNVVDGRDFGVSAVGGL